MVDPTLSDVKIFQPEEDKEAFDGSVTGNSSKSSMASKNSAFSSSSRRSSSNWEMYSWFRRYDEEMALFDRISERKLAETG